MKDGSARWAIPDDYEIETDASPRLARGSRLVGPSEPDLMARRDLGLAASLAVLGLVALFAVGCKARRTQPSPDEQSAVATLPSVVEPAASGTDAAPAEASPDAATAPPAAGDTAAPAAASAASAAVAGRSPKVGVVRVGAMQVNGNGRLPPAVIQRVVRQNFDRFRLCYENGLRNNANLQGRVSVRFVIGRDGAVSTVGNGDSDLPDGGVVSCVVRAFYGLTFPKPEGGIVMVTYPIQFTPGG
jgi:hypothetical protein